MTAKETMTIIADDGTGTVSGATVISPAGIIIGMTNDDGKIEVNSKLDFPLSVRNLGFETASVTTFIDTVILKTAVYDLPEIEIDTKSKPVKKITCFVREYCTGSNSTDTMQLYCEYMMTAYYAPERVKGYKKSDKKLKVRNRRQYASLKSVNGMDSVFIPNQDDDIMLLSMVSMVSGLPYSTVGETEKIKQGSFTDTIPGKYSPSVFFRKSSNGFSVETDMLSQYKDHRWSPAILKIFGATMDLEQFRNSRLYGLTDSGKYGLNDFIFGTTTIQILGRGKLIKKFFNSPDAVTMYSYQELYPIEMLNLSVEEYKADKDDKSDLPFTYPDNIEALSPAVQSMIKAGIKQ